MIRNAMDLYIETLTGTAFELRVSPFETVISVKAKIQRQEGIPISQQHLIWQSVELDDDYCLHDYSISDGATLKMVLAMRGGPINTRRVAMEDPALREMAEYMEANRDELLDRFPSNNNRQVTLLVYRDGDQLNFFRVVDRGDGTLTPLSESLSGASMYNLYDDEDDDEPASATKDKVQENDKTKEKMKLLRMKMENMSIKKKPTKKHAPRPPSSGRPSSRTRRHFSTSAGRKVAAGTSYHNAHNLPSLNPLPPVGKTVTINAATIPATDSLSESSGDEIHISSTHKNLESAKLSRLPSVHEDLSLALTPTTMHASTDVGVLGTEATSCEVMLSKPQISSSPVRRKEIGELKEVTEFTKTSPDLSPPPPSSDAQKEITLDNFKETLSLRPAASSKSIERLLSHGGYESSGSAAASGPKKEKSIESLGRPVNSSKYASLERKQGIVLESLSHIEARGLLRQASLERVGSSKISSFVNSASKNRGSFTFKEQGRISTPEGRMVSARLQRVSASRDGRVISPSQRLPPVKQKKKGKRCFFCSKKTGLATSHSCRCGHNFCATHRYAEAHSCTFDYKTEGRKLLEQSNPVVSAPKLPKI